MVFQHDAINSWSDNDGYSSGISHKGKGPSSVVDKAKLITETSWLVGHDGCSGSLLIRSPYCSISSSKIAAFCRPWQWGFYKGLWAFMSPAIKTLSRIMSSHWISLRALLVREILPLQVHPFSTWLSYMLTTQVFLLGVLNR